jgi:hypothetical protein
MRYLLLPFLSEQWFCSVTQRYDNVLFQDYHFYIVHTSLYVMYKGRPFSKHHFVYFYLPAKCMLILVISGALQFISYMFYFCKAIISIKRACNGNYNFSYVVLCTLYVLLKVYTVFTLLIM